MATLRLFDPTPACPDGLHNVTAPGGYESWRFHGWDQERNVWIAIGFHYGYQLHPEYLQRYQAYHRRPQRNEPPVPAEYPCLTIAVYENQKRSAASTIQFSAGSLQAGDRIITLGPNRIELAHDHFSVEIAKDPVHAKLVFRPLFPITSETPFPPPSDNHRWRYTPVCQVTGEVRVGSRAISFEGTGQLNHYYGADSMALAGRRWLRAYILFPRAAVNIYNVDQRTLVLQSGEAGADLCWRNIQPIVSHKTFWTLQYPSGLDFVPRPMVFLRNPRVVVSAPATLELFYDAYVHGQQTTALVEIEYPRRPLELLSSWWMKRSIVTA